MARPRGPLGNAPRDLEDDFVGVPAEKITTGPPPRWPPNPKKVKGNTFHSKVTGNTSLKRADRAGHFRRGGWVSRARGGDIGERETEPTPDEISRRQIKRPLLGYKRGGRADGGDVDEPKAAQEARESAAKTTRKSRSMPDAFPVGGMGSVENEQRPREERRPELYGRYKRGGEAIDEENRAMHHDDGKFARGGRLTAKARQSLPSSDFALPGRGKGPKGAGSGSYPIPDRSHAQNALARSSGKPVAAEVRRKVEAKYPGLVQKK